MIDIGLKYEAKIFGNFGDLLPTPELFTRLLSLFGDKNLLPSTFHEISSLGIQPRIKLSDQNKEWKVDFGTNYVSITKDATDPKGTNLGTAESFTEGAIELFDRILAEFKKKPNRIALITNGLLKEMTDQKLSEIHGKIFKQIDFYHQNRPFHWMSRNVAKITIYINNLPEQVNVNTNINRMQGQLIKYDTISEFDRIEVGFDINTISENQETRFDIESLRSFYSQANEIRNQLLSDLEVLLYA